MVADAQATKAAERAERARQQADEAAREMLEEYDDAHFEWAVAALAGAQVARDRRLLELGQRATAKTITPVERREAAQLARNNVAWEALRHLRILAPYVDGNRRRGQYLAYRRGGKSADGRGRHYPTGGYSATHSDLRCSG